MGHITAVCLSLKKQTRKKNVNKGLLVDNYGLLNDAHASTAYHRQVSLLSQKSIDKMKDKGLEVKAGDFGENLTTQNIDLSALSIGNRLKIGATAILEVTQKGKICHNPCAIYHQVGDCVMPTEGIFARVIRGGQVKIGDEIKVLLD
ncbi:MOSC domain-containing protein [Methanobacterium movens]